MPPVAERNAVFEALKELFAPYAPRLTVTADDEKTYMLDGLHSSALKRTMFFGGVRLGRSYVSFYLMPVYTNPELLSPISDALRKRMQGKSCFNFSKPEPELLEELGRLTRTGFEKFRSLGYVR